MGYTAWSVSAFEQPSTAKWNILGTNDAEFDSRFRNGYGNYRLSITVASNNITVALKDINGNDPSAASPVVVKINNTFRTVIAALSLTRNAGTSWFGSGASELATQEIDYFAFLAWDSSNSLVRIGFSRIPYPNVYSDFSATTTNEKHGAFDTAPGATDDVVLIGRFAATLSATASFNWSVPSFTSNNLILRPIFNTRVLIWAPTLVGFSVNPTSSVYEYQLKYSDVDIIFHEGANGTSNATNFTATLPFTSATLTNAQWAVYSLFDTNTGTDENLGAAQVGSNTNSLSLQRSTSAGVAASSTGWTNVNGKRIRANLTYKIALV